MTILEAHRNASDSRINRHEAIVIMLVLADKGPKKQVLYFYISFICFVIMCMIPEFSLRKDTNNEAIETHRFQY